MSTEPKYKCSKCKSQCQLLPMTDDVQMVRNASLLWMSQCCHAAIFVARRRPKLPPSA